MASDVLLAKRLSRPAQQRAHGCRFEFERRRQFVVASAVAAEQQQRGVFASNGGQDAKHAPAFFSGRGAGPAGPAPRCGSGWPVGRLQPRHRPWRHELSSLPTGWSSTRNRRGAGVPSCSFTSTPATIGAGSRRCGGSPAVIAASPTRPGAIPARRCRPLRARTRNSTPWTTPSPCWMDSASRKQTVVGISMGGFAGPAPGDAAARAGPLAGHRGNRLRGASVGSAAFSRGVRGDCPADSGVGDRAVRAPLSVRAGTGAVPEQGSAGVGAARARVG